MKKFTIALLLLAFTPMVVAAPIDFDNLNVASAAYGVSAGTGWTRLLATYKNDIYFIARILI